MNRIMTTMIGMLVIMLLTAGAAAADIPRLISFQGRLSDTQGLPLTGSYDLTFRFYTASSGGAAIWTEAQSGIGVSNGIYNVYLGEVTPFDALSFDTPYWISVEVFTDGEMTPRRRLTATGYALRAVAAETATTVAGSGTVSGAQLIVTDTATINGNLGIGTATGTARLTVIGDAAVSETFTVGDSKLVITSEGLIGINNPTPATALDVAGTITATSIAVSETITATAFLYNGISINAPVGVVLAWLKSFSNTPGLDSGWVECNGQTLNDPESVYNGQTIPDLNSGTRRFLRGSTTSGTTGGSETHTHAIQGASGSYGIGTGPNCDVLSSGTLPSYYEVVWIMKVK